MTPDPCKAWTRPAWWLLAAALLVPAPRCNAASPNPYPALGPGLSLLERNYLFDGELSPPRLMDEAGKFYSRDIADLSIERLSDRTWVYRSPDCELRVEIPADATVRNLEAPLSTIGRFVESCTLRRPPKLPALDSWLLSGVLSGLDPYSVVFDEKNQNEHNIQYQGRLAGIGARIGARRNQLTLIEVYPDSPAARADLRNDDEVLRIDDLSTKNILASDAVEHIRGEEGTTVTLLIRRKGEPEPRPVVVTRGIVIIPSVKSRILNADILYTEITQFSQTTPDDFRQHLKKAVDDKNLRGVIIDLRRNSGGSMMGSSAIGDLFLRDGLLITTAGRDGQPARGLTPEVRASGLALAPDLPVIFLTSPMTASGSELLAASLRNNDRALLIGEHTFGKGCIQKTFPLHETSTMKMTVGNFLPNGQPIPGGGLVPDIEVLNYRVGKGHLQVPSPIRQTDMPFWLRTPKWSNAEATPSAHRISFAEEFPDDDPSLVERSEDETLEEAKPNPEKPDRVVEIAAALLRNHGSPSARQMLDDAREFLERTVETADADLIDFMYGHGLDWTDGPHPQTQPRLKLDVTPMTPLRAGHESEVEVRLTNDSAAPFYRVRGLLESTSVAFDRQPVAFGRIEPGATRAWRMKVKPPGTSRTGRVRIQATLYDDDGEIVQLDPVRVAMAEIPRPHLALQATVRAMPDDASRFEIVLAVENRGDGPAGKIVVRMKHPPEERFEILEGTGDVDTLEAGAQASFVLKARMLGSFDPVPSATLTVSEMEHGLYLERETPFVPSDDPAPWNEPPRIAIEGIEEVDQGRYEVIAQATDDHGLAEVRARLEERTVAYVEPAGVDRTVTRIRLPFDPGDDVKRIRIEAVDNQGLRGFYLGSL